MTRDLRREMEARLRAVVADLGDPIFGVRNGEGVINGWGDDRVMITFAGVEVTTQRDEGTWPAMRLRQLVSLDTRRPDIAIPWSITALRRAARILVGDDEVAVDLIESSSGAWVADGLVNDRRFVIVAGRDIRIEDVALVPVQIHFSADGRARTS